MPGRHCVLTDKARWGYANKPNITGRSHSVSRWGGGGLGMGVTPPFREAISERSLSKEQHNKTKEETGPSVLQCYLFPSFRPDLHLQVAGAVLQPSRSLRQQAARRDSVTYT
jgi:hypothetical protein